MNKDKIIAIIEQVGKKKVKFQVADVLAELARIKVSRQYVAMILADLVNRGQLVRSGIKRYTFYALPENSVALVKKETRVLTNNKKLSDYEVFNDLTQTTALFKKVTKNTSSILSYGFTEMLNNAIEHSRTKRIRIEFFLDKGDVVFTIRDYGIGVFNSVKNKYNLASDLFAIQEILKGKTTTAPRAHSGEGIYFTSKIADRFVLESFGTQLIVDNQIQDIFVNNIRRKGGTLVSFRINKKSNKHLSRLFNSFASKENNYAFDKTVIQVKLYTMGTVYVSRSQAKRLLANLGRKFKVIVLDYERVASIGQAFADEIYRVFSTSHPQIKIESINASKNVSFMIERAKSG